MKSLIKISIDGFIIDAVKGSTVLDTALEHGICIPSLCHAPSLPDIGACRICVVENIVNGRSKVTASCTLNVEEGMVILANSDKIKRLRRNLAELLVAQAPNSRAVQDIAARCGVKEVRYPFRNENCVLCGRCVRTCNDVWRAKALGFVGRGKNRHVDYPFGIKPDYCKQCNSCIQLCPMIITPCAGPMKPGEEYLCNMCESQLIMAEALPGKCVWCELGKGFDCARYC